MGFILPSNDAAMIASGVGMAASAIMSVFTEIRANNVSANGSYVYLYTTNSKGEKIEPFGQNGIFLTKFDSDANAFNIEPYVVTKAEPSHNGPLVTSQDIPLYQVNVALIPFSPDSQNLDLLMREASYNSELEVNMSIGYIRPNAKAMAPGGIIDALKGNSTETVFISFTSGKIQEGTPSPSVNQYRLAPREYSFIFSGIPDVHFKPPKGADTLHGAWSL